MRKIASSIMMLACGLFGTAQAQEPQVTVDVSAGASVSTNPFLYVDSKAAAAATLEVRPMIVWENESGRTSLDGTLRLAQYSQRYGNDFSGRAGVASNQKLDERTTLSMAGFYQTSRSVVQDGFFFPIEAPLDPGSIPDPSIPPVDTSIAGVRTRRQNAGASIGLSHAIDERSSVDAGVSFDAAFVDRNVGFDYQNLSGHIGYQRQLTERTALTASVSVGRVNYLGRRVGDSTIISPQLGLRQKLNSRLSLVAGAGFSYVRTDLVTGVRSGRTSFSGDVGLCDEGRNRTLCVSANRSAQPTALGGVSNVTAIAVNYDAQLSEKDRLAFSGRYGRTDQSGEAGFPLQTRITDIVGASATYSRKLSDRVSLNVTPAFTKIYSNTQGRRDANYSLMVGVTVRFGKLR